MKKRGISIRELSELSGFSPATVSKTLNAKKGVSKETADKILRLAKETGYINENKIDEIRLVIYKKYGSIVSETPFFSELIEGIEKECRENDMSMSVLNLRPNDMDFETNLRIILEDSSAAILLLATELDEEDVEIFRNAIAPVVILDSWFYSQKFDTVIINNSDSVKYLVDYLVEKGHKEIGYIRSSVPIQNFFYRYDGYVRGMRCYQLPIKEEYHVSLSPTLDGAYKDMMEYLSITRKMPTAYIADNDIIALGAMKGLKENGFKIPDDISIVGFDNLTYCDISSPGLTTIHVYKHEVGKAAVRRLIEKIKYIDQAYQKIEICTAFVERDSVKDLN